MVLAVEKLKPLLLPAGTVTAPCGADVYGLVGSPVSHHLTCGEVGAPAPACPNGLSAPGPACPDGLSAPGAACPDELITRPTHTASSTSGMPTINGNERRVTKPLIEFFLISDFGSLVMINDHAEAIPACTKTPGLTWAG